MKKIVLLLLLIIAAVGANAQDDAMEAAWMEMGTESDTAAVSSSSAADVLP